MIACTRCGRWHSDAEAVTGKRLTCTEVKQYWAGRRTRHQHRYGHIPQITTDESDNWNCLKCNRKL